VSAHAQGTIAPLLREAVRTGAWDALGELLAADARLDSSSEAGRMLVEGPEAIVAHLSKPGPGEVTDWIAREWEGGVAATFEWRGRSVDRRRWYVRSAAGRVTGIWSYAARPADGAGVELSEEVLGRLGPGVRRAPLEHSGNSGAALERVLLADGGELIAKRVGPAADWLGRVTGDRGRTAMLWRSGAFDRMPASVDHGIESVLADGDGWWVLMRDLSASFLGDERRLTRAESRRILEAAAEIHAEFRGDVPEGLTSRATRIGIASRRIAESERAGSDLLPKQLEAAWDAFAESVPEVLGDAILAAVDDPEPLGAAIGASGPSTLLHGDLRDDNLGLTDEGIALLDWDLASEGSPSVEFAWYLCHDAWRIDATHEEIEADFRAAEDAAVSDEAHELGMLTGLVQYGWIFGHSLRVHPDPAEQAWARAELDWWIPRTARALESVGGMPH
jgi:hypothetical protein